MSRDDIIRIMRELIGPQSENWAINEAMLEEWLPFLQAIAAAEREACAKVCDKWHRIAQQYETSHRTHSYIMGKGAAICAHNIRARKP